MASEIPKVGALWCRSAHLGYITIPASGTIEVSIKCRCNGCKRGGVFPFHVFTVKAGDDSTEKIRPRETVFADPGFPGEILGDKERST